MPHIAVKGTHDLYGKEASAYQLIQNVFKAVAELYGYRPIETPILEYTDVFLRSTGEGSDVVRKEMYTFLDKGERSVTMRPEGTAGVVRSICEHKLAATEDLPIKAYYAGPVFRYERPQLGRYRQFLQAGVEAIGVDSPFLDAEAICLAMQCLEMLGFENLKIKVNTLGDASSRLAYKEALTAYFAEHVEHMCQDCQERLKLNPMRILDCKVPEDQEIAKGAPKMRDYLSGEAEERFYKTLSILAERDIDYEIDDSLVRGLDYYGQIVFELHVSSPSGKDYGAVLGGGHYDGMLAEFGGPKSFDHGVGFAMGVERVYSLMNEFHLLDDLDTGVDIYAMPIGEEALERGFFLVEELRKLGYSVVCPFETAKLGSYFKKASRVEAKVALIFGTDELDRGVVQIKNLASFEQSEADIDTLDVTLDRLFAEIEGEDEHHHHQED